MSTPSHESLSTVLDKVFSGELKHVREANSLIGKCNQLKASSTKVLVDESLARVVRPDTDVGKHPVKYTQDLLKFLQAFHSDGLFRTRRKWCDEMSKLFDSLDFSDHASFKRTLIDIAKRAPDSELDKIPANLRSLPGSGTIKNLYAPSYKLGDDWGTPLPEAQRFMKPSPLLNDTHGERGRKEYVGKGELAVLSPDEIKKVLQAYVDAEKCFSMARKIQNSSWPLISHPRKKMLSLYGTTSEHQLWSRHGDDKDVMAVCGSLMLMLRWVDGATAMTAWALSNTRPQQAFMEAMFKWANLSYKLHAGSVSQESITPSFKW